MKLRADLHTHSISSGHAYSTIAEMALAARKRGLKILALTDHAPDMPGGPHEYYFFNLRALPEYLHGVRILKGAEVNIISANGKLDLPVEMLASLDVVVASSHAVTTPETLGKKKNTEMYLKVVANPHIDILGHIENPLFELDYPTVIKAAKAHNKLVEINNASFTIARHGSFNNCLEIMRILKAENMPVVINSDAHVASRVGEISRALEVALEQGIKKENILNFNAQKTAEWFQVKL
ncbi:histidinol phosphatase [Candidatus Termititenax dinenymphae]|uniref:Histidinol phosphatase n=1 Tax=Candidatus Termititenax dinenymphae TaxID=2218523 RepID=A0A388TKU9_9BACT|nr:histidinol phosphatase [Candidatus Termititenax dinenymphae]